MMDYLQPNDNAIEKILQSPIDGSLELVNVRIPSLIAFFPDTAIQSESAIIIACGGGFHSLSIEYEGSRLAQALTKLGITAFVLKYRLVPTFTNDPFSEFFSKYRHLSRQQFHTQINDTIKLAQVDGLVAFHYLTTRADEFGIDTNRIGLIGFSAGSAVVLAQVLANRKHLAVTNTQALTLPSPIQPAFLASIYGYHFDNLGLLDYKQIPVCKTHVSDNSHIPLFIACAKDDGLGIQPQSHKLYHLWQQANHPAIIHWYQSGGHGFGLRQLGKDSDNWLQDFTKWLHGLAFI